MKRANYIWSIQELEKKVEKHNNLVERMALVEASAKSAHKCLDELYGEADKGSADIPEWPLHAVKRPPLKGWTAPPSKDKEKRVLS